MISIFWGVFQHTFLYVNTAIITRDQQKYVAHRERLSKYSNLQRWPMYSVRVMFQCKFATIDVFTRFLKHNSHLIVKQCYWVRKCHRPARLENQKKTYKAHKVAREYEERVRSYGSSKGASTEWALNPILATVRVFRPSYVSDLTTSVPLNRLIGTEWNFKPVPCSFLTGFHHVG